MLTRLHKHAGFSLIELCVGLVVVGILMGLAIPGMRTWLQNSQLRSTAESVQNGLQLARAEAVRRNAFVTYTQSGAGWIVTSGGTTLQTGTTEAAGTATVTQSPNPIDSTTTQDTVTFTGVGWVTPVPSSDIKFDVANSNGGQCVASGGSMRCLRVTVSAGGQNRMCDPAAASSTAAVCP